MSKWLQLSSLYSTHIQLCSQIQLLVHCSTIKSQNFTLKCDASDNTGVIQTFLAPCSWKIIFSNIFVKHHSHNTKDKSEKTE